eukprot:UN05735
MFVRYLSYSRMYSPSRPLRNHKTNFLKFIIFQMQMFD